jgi:isopenicillin N synthase-like dioxygenase
MATPIQLPIIDISDPLNPAIGKDMLDAAIKYGFFYVHGKGSDFSADAVDSTFDLVCTSYPNIMKIQILMIV